LKIFFNSCAWLIICCCVGTAYGQTAFISGKITDENQIGIAGVNVVSNTGSGTSTDSLGRFSLVTVPDSAIVLVISHISYQTLVRKISIASSENLLLNLSMVPKSTVLNEVEIKERRTSRDFVPSVTTINPESAILLPSAFGEFNKVLATLPGVVSNNELSATYSVRGGNFDENLVYVNDIPIYRPFLIRAGEQEGLSFINPRLVESIEFSSGGWAPEYGDKLSSSLNIVYKKPRQFGGSASISLLGGDIHLEGASKNQRFTYLAGVRHKSSQYLLNTFETKGEYFPKFTDIQSFFTYKLDRKGRTELSLLLGYANNRYLVEPETRETKFGTFNESFKFIVGFDGQDLLKYQTFD